MKNTIMVSNIYLNTMASNMENYRGTFSCNNIPTVNKDKNLNLYIINLSEEGGIGSHFVALCVQKHNKRFKCVYFDSFGEHCTNKHILSFMGKINKTYCYNSMQIQHYLSEYCGFYSLGCVIEHQKKGNLHNYIKHFNVTDLYLNDKIVITYIANNSIHMHS